MFAPHSNLAFADASVADVKQQVSPAKTFRVALASDHLTEFAGLAMLRREGPHRVSASWAPVAMFQTLTGEQVTGTVGQVRTLERAKTSEGNKKILAASLQAVGALLQEHREVNGNCYYFTGQPNGHDRSTFRVGKRNLPIIHVGRPR